MRTRLAASALLATLILTGCRTPPVASPSPSDTAPSRSGVADVGYLDPSLPTTERVEILLSQMTLEEKFGQMTQLERGSVGSGDVATFTLGSVLNGGGTIGYRGDFDTWSTTVEALQREAVDDTRLGIPILFGVDVVHGFGGMYGATVFPQQIALGAANDPALMTQIGHASAEEAAAAGVRWTFGPVLAVPSDIRWGRTYEAYSQDPARVSALGAAYITGLQGDDLTRPDTILATAKHFIGDGSTVYGTSTQVIQVQYQLDQGDTPADPALLNDVLLPPYRAAVDAGALSVMASYNSWGGEKVHGIRTLLTDTLRDDLGFTGFVVSDWAGLDQINPDDYQDSVERGINAGVDMAMVPFDAGRFQQALAAGVDSGAITIERIDEAVARILTVKFDMGLFENPYADPSLATTVGSAEHRAIARRAVAESQVLLKSDGAVPISGDARTIVVVGNAANDMGIQAGGWTMSWQGGVGDEIPGTTIFEGIADRADPGVQVLDSMPDAGSVDVCVAVAGELPYAEGVGDSSDLSLSALSVVDAFAGRCERTIMVIVSGRPVMITEALDRADVVVAAWLPGTAGEGVADTLFGDLPFTGTLPMNWPRDPSQVPSLPAGDSYLFALGYGITTP